MGNPCRTSRWQFKRGVATDRHARGTVARPASGDLFQVVGRADRDAGKLLDDVAVLQPGPGGRRIRPNATHQGTPVLVGSHRQPQAGPPVAVGHRFQSPGVETDDDILAIGGHRHAELPGQTQNVLGRRAVDRGVALRIFDPLLTKELLRSVTPGSGRRRVNSYRHADASNSARTHVARGARQLSYVLAAGCRGRPNGSR